jgi:type II secretory pathway component GspD/PulD (secretin)
MPISNVIGRIRFIPDPRSKSILILAPPEFIESIEQMIRQLDIPGKQVMIKAIIMEVNHRKLTSLGVQLASDQLAFGTLDENAATILNQLSVLETRGSFTFSAVSNVTALIDFLVKKVNAKILNQQTLWTKDNEEADFFKGQKVAFNTDISVSEVGGRVTSGIDFQRVGMTLRTRPKITPENKVDMTINLMISQRTSEFINEQPVRTEMDTETALIVEDGETIMLGGMLFQEDNTVLRKVPLFGDLPLMGGLFRHNEIVKENSELLVFITPYVIDEPNMTLPATKEQLEQGIEKLDTVQNQLQNLEDILDVNEYNQ